MATSVGYWQSCTGCTDGEDGYVNEKYFPLHPKHGVPQGMGCDECKGKGVVFHPFTNADAAYWEQQGRAVNSEEFRKLYQQDWPPALEIPADAPQPWLVMGDARAVRNVMMNDYHAPPRENLYWQTTSGPVANVTHRKQIGGASAGTLFVLVPAAGYSREHMAILEEALLRGFVIRDLPTKREPME